MPRPDGKAIEVLLVDDDEKFRAVLRVLLGGEQDFTVVGEAGDGDTAVAAAQELLPDVVLLDVRMRSSGGIGAARAIRELVPKTEIVMLTVSDETEDLYQALRAGASGYLLKDCSLDDIGTCLRSVCADQTVLSRPVAARLVSELVGSESFTPQLTVRELQVLRLVADGEANRVIAGLLHLSEHTVKRHVANTLAKLHLRTRLEAAIYAKDRDLFADGG